MTEQQVTEQLINCQERDIALMAAIRLGSFVHLTLEDGRVEQGWLHLHGLQLECCATEGRGECDDHRRRVTWMLRGGQAPEYSPLDVERVIRVDIALGGQGRYVPMWHHPDYADRHHALSRERLACCSLLPSEVAP